MLAYDIKHTEQEMTIILNTDMVGDRMAGLKEELKKAIIDKLTQINLDLGHVNVMDSSGIGILVQAQNSLEKYGGALKMQNVSGNLLELFRSMRLDTRFHLTTE